MASAKYFMDSHDPAMIAIRKQVIRAKNVTKHGKYYHYVDHEFQLATIGFLARKTLTVKYGPDIRFDSGTLILMRARYSQNFTKE